MPEQKTVIGTGPEATLNWLREGRGAVGVFVRVGGDSIRLWTAYYIAGEGACTAAKVGACAECDSRSKDGCMALGEQPGSHEQARGQRTVSTLGWLREEVADGSGGRSAAAGPRLDRSGRPFSIHASR